MKKIILISFAFAIVNANTRAQEGKTRLTAEQRTEKMIAKLNDDLAFNDDQKLKVKEVVLKREMQREEINKQFEKERAAFKEANKKNMAATEEQLKIILTPEQIEKLKKHRKEMRLHHKQKCLYRSHYKGDKAPRSRISEPK